MSAVKKLYAELKAEADTAKAEETVGEFAGFSF